MVAFADFPNLIGCYHLDASGFDAINDRLVDQSGFGNHLAISGATDPTYRTVAGHQMIDWTNLYFFEGDSNLTPEFSLVYVGASDYGGADGTLRILNTADRIYTAVDDRDGNPSTLTASNWHSAVYKQKALEQVTLTLRLFDDIGVSATGTAWTTGAMSMVTVAAKRDPATLLARANSSTVLSASYSSTVQLASAPRTGSRMRLGHLNAAGTALAASKYTCGKRLYIFNGNLFDSASLADAIAAEKLLWGIS